MKRLLLCLLLLPLCSQAQKDAIGFGPLKINATKLEELPALLGTKLYTYGDPDFKKDQRLKELDSTWYEGMGSADSQRRKRFVKGYRIITLSDCKDGDMELRQLELTFYKGVLIKISALTNLQLSAWCEAQFGKPEDHSKYDTVACINYYDGKKRQEVNTEQDYTWRKGKEQARFYMKYTYDNDCRMRFRSSFVMEDAEAVKHYERLKGG